MPLMQSETIRSYQQIIRSLTEECGYEGIFIIFDEFSKYIEGHEKSGFAEDMKTLPIQSGRENLRFRNNMKKRL